jgi:hypothetical protein
MASVFDLATFGNGAKIAGDVVSVGAGFLGSQGIGRVARDEDQLLQQQEQMAETQFYQQGLARAKRLRQVMSQATVEEAARGVSVASPSFKAVQRSSFERFQEDQDAAALNLSFEKSQIEAKRKEVRDKEKSAKVSLWGKVISGIL